MSPSPGFEKIISTRVLEHSPDDIPSPEARSILAIVALDEGPWTCCWLDEMAHRGEVVRFSRSGAAGLYPIFARATHPDVSASVRLRGHAVGACSDTRRPVVSGNGAQPSAGVGGVWS
ncbi:hypothetical protein R1X32_02585 (plasmid) [Rhodococcus opacus]|uniref:hypothetical protein n=1 Tax=Rhodococcus opacus TaxID=37919 RepID=UPI00146B738D|nr:hypothetical protein HJ581_0046645 [Rhodococcus opacus]